MSFHPRSATVRAATDCTMLEMLRNVLDILQKNKTFRAKLDATYRQRALENHLRSVPVLAGLSVEFIDYLRERVELVRYTPGQIICRQGEPADAFYLVRLGFVKVSEAASGRRSRPGVRPARRVRRRDRPARRRRSDGHLHGARSRRARADLRRRLPPDDERLPRDSGRVRAGRPGTAGAESRAGAGDRLGRVERLSVAGPDGGAEPARPRSRKMHAVRSVRARVRRRARRRHAARPRRAALRQVSGRDLVPPVPRSALHGRLPGGIDPPPQLARSDYRRLVHRLRAVRQQLSVREHHAASVQRGERRSRPS